eukprot:scaffold26609_cov126-Isochrysis_galbana.AAC.2
MLLPEVTLTAAVYCCFADGAKAGQVCTSAGQLMAGNRTLCRTCMPVPPAERVELYLPVQGPNLHDGCEISHPFTEISLKFHPVGPVRVVGRLVQHKVKFSELKYTYSQQFDIVESINCSIRHSQATQERTCLVGVG